MCISSPRLVRSEQLEEQGVVMYLVDHMGLWRAQRRCPRRDAMEGLLEVEGPLHLRMYVCMYACMHVCMYACMYIYMVCSRWKARSTSAKRGICRTSFEIASLVSLGESERAAIGSSAASFSHKQRPRQRSCRP